MRCKYLPAALAVGALALAAWALTPPEPLFVSPAPGYAPLAERMRLELERPAAVAGERLLLHALGAVRERDGLYLELGVYSGGTLSCIADFFPKRTVDGFDSFEGLPEAWRWGFAKGAFSLEGALPAVPANARLHKGWFADTLPAFLAARPNETVVFLHVDCDLYSSARDALALLAPRIAPGTVIVFDELVNYPGWDRGEFRALVEATLERGWEFEWLASAAPLARLHMRGPRVILDNCRKDYPEAVAIRITKA